MSLETTLFLLVSLFVIVALATFRYWRLSKLERRSIERLEALKEAGLEIPPTLHPVIDPTLCISSTSCTKACPQGDNVLGLILGKGTLVDSSQCIGHGRCALECPADAIRLVFGTAERGVDIPELGSGFETNVKGLHIAGELGGMGLIMNAVRQAVEAVAAIHTSLKAELRRGQDEELCDVAIIGAGPAGLAAALSCKQKGLSYRLLEREATFGGSVLHYPRKKLVMTAPVELPLVGKVHGSTLSKEELLDIWHNAVESQQIRLEGGALVEEITRGEDGIFQIKATTVGAIRARRVLLCIGRRGTPRKLGVPGEDRPTVYYSLLEPGVFSGRKVLVVGGGDSAIEAACMLGEETSAQVYLSYRRGGISRAKPKNKEHLDAALKAGKVTALWESDVKEIREGEVSIKIKGAMQTLPIDDVLIFAGGELPVGLLSRAGVTMKRHFGEEVEEKGEKSAAQVFERIREQSRAKGLQDVHEHIHEPPRLLPYLLALTGLGVLALLTWLGEQWYFATPEVRESVEDLQVFAPSGMWGHTVGFAALFFMLANFSYFVRREMEALKRAGNIHTWMHLHVFFGLMSGAVTLFHTSLYMRNVFAVSLYISVGIVVLTGVVGRYFYGFVPLDPRGRPLAHASLLTLAERLGVDFGHLYHNLSSAVALKKVLETSVGEASTQAPSIPVALAQLMWAWPSRYMSMRRLLRKARLELLDEEKFSEFSHFAQEMFRLRFQMDYFPHLKRLMGSWRVMHAVLAFFLLFLVVAHVVVSFWVGYRWIF